MATNILFRRTLSPTVPNTTSVKGSPLTSSEIDGNFKSVKDAIDDILLNGIGSILARHSATATLGQTVFDLPFVYSPGTNNLLVFVNGSIVERNVDYTETSTTRITFTSGLELGQEVTFLTNISPSPGLTYSAAGVASYYLATNGAQTSFTLPVAVLSKNNTQIFNNGIYQAKDGYTVAGTSLTFSEAPVSGHIEVNVIAATAIGETTADLVEYTPSGTGATTRSVQQELRERVSVTQFAGIDPTGATDSSAGIQFAMNSLGSAGGTVYVPNGVKLLIDSYVNIPSNVSLVGPHTFVGTPQDNAASPYGNLGGVLMINPLVSVTLKGGASISGLFIWRKGMTFPATNTNAFSGTALLGEGDDIGVSNCLVMGFDKAYYSTGKQRPRIHNVYMDCNNGIDIAICYDIAYVTECHAWPFSTIASPGAPIIRSGTAYNIRDVGDWAKFTNCFSYGYAIGASVTNVNSSTWIGCSFDNAPGNHPGSIGMQVLGNCEDTRIINCQTAAHATAGILINAADGTKTTITGHNVWGGMSHGVLVYGGNVTMRTSGFRDLGNAISVTSATADIDVDDCWFRTLSGVIINATVPKANVRLGANNDFLNILIDPTINMTLPAIASAASVQLPSTGDVFYVSGSVGIGTLLHAWPGRRVTLVFVSGAPVYSSSGTSGSIRLNGGATFTAPAGGSLSLCGIGGNAWVETGRAA